MTARGAIPALLRGLAWLAAALWLWRRPEPPEATQDGLRAALRAGAVLGVGEWTRLDWETRAAMAAAGDGVYVERALLLAGLIRGDPACVAEASRVLDGGRTAEDARLSALLSKALAGRMQRG